MKIAKILSSLCVAALAALPLAACGGSSPAPAPTAEPAPTVDTVSIYPERGSTPHIVKGASGKLKCADKIASTELVLGGTVSLNGDFATAKQSDSEVVLHFEHGNSFGGSLIVNGTLPALIPLNGQGSGAKDLKLAYADFGHPTKIVICGNPA